MKMTNLPEVYLKFCKTVFFLKLLKNLSLFHPLDFGFFGGRRIFRNDDSFLLKINFFN
jgi:hypothetical protein